MEWTVLQPKDWTGEKQQPGQSAHIRNYNNTFLSIWMIFFFLRKIWSQIVDWMHLTIFLYTHAIVLACLDFQWKSLSQDLSASLSTYLPKLICQSEHQTPCVMTGVPVPGDRVKNTSNKLISFVCFWIQKKSCLQISLLTTIFWWFFWWPEVLLHKNNYDIYLFLINICPETSGVG